MKAVLIACCLAFSATAACAGVEQIPVPCQEAKLCLWERPLIAAPAGWALDPQWSPRLRISVYTPEGSDFSNAPTSIMVRAVEHADVADLADFIQSESDRLIGPSLTVTLIPVTGVKDGDGARLRGIRLAPRQDRAGAVQSIVFAEDGLYYIEFTLNARSVVDHDKAWPIFLRFVAGYRKIAPASARASAALH